MGHMGRPYLHLVYKKPAAVLTKKLILNFIYTRKKPGVNKICLRKTFRTPEFQSRVSRWRIRNNYN